MGRPGPKPQPASVKKAKGNPGKRPLGDDPVLEDDEAAEAGAQTQSVVQAPGWLSEGGRAVWDHLAPRLASMRLLASTDADTFGRYCELFFEWKYAMEEIREMGRWYEIETASGVVRRPHPLLAYSVRLNRELQAAEANFGLNPAERQRIFAARAAASIGGFGDLFGRSNGKRRPVKEKRAVESKQQTKRSSPIGRLH